MDLLIEKRKLSEFGGISLPNGENRTQIRQGQLTSFSAFFEHIPRKCARLTTVPLGSVNNLVYT